jgi:hypothetical protein
MNTSGSASRALAAIHPRCGPRARAESMFAFLVDTGNTERNHQCAVERICVSLPQGAGTGRKVPGTLHDTWRGNPKGKVASWESGSGTSREEPMSRKFRILGRRLNCLNSNPTGCIPPPPGKRLITRVAICERVHGGLDATFRWQMMPQ